MSLWWPIQCKPDISRSCISRSHIGPHFLATHFANFVDMTPKSAIFSRNRCKSLDPVHARQFFAKSAHRGCLWSGSRETIFHEICSEPIWLTCEMRAGTHAVRWPATEGQSLTSPLYQSRVLLIHCPCKSVPQTANQGKTNAFLIKSSLTSALLWRRTGPQQIQYWLARDWWTFLWWPCTPKYVLYHDAKRFKYDHQTAK